MCRLTVPPQVGRDLWNLNEMMKAAGGFGSRWMTDLINNIVKESCIPDDGKRVS